MTPTNSVLSVASRARRDETAPWVTRLVRSLPRDASKCPKRAGVCATNVQPNAGRLAGCHAIRSPHLHRQAGRVSRLKLSEIEFRVRLSPLFLRLRDARAFVISHGLVAGTHDVGAAGRTASPKEE